MWQILEGPLVLTIADSQASVDNKYARQLFSGEWKEPKRIMLGAVQLRAVLLRAGLIKTVLLRTVLLTWQTKP